MMSSKVHSQRNIPFSWENEPGVSKAAPPQHHHRDVVLPPKLPPPPCPAENSRVSYHDMNIPLPPCAFQPPSRSFSKKGIKKIDDPFLIAYREVTKSIRKGKGVGANKEDQRFGVIMKKNMSIFSCKQSSCSVVEDSVVRFSQLPISRSSSRSD
ncbi:hypothetical protein C2S51_016153 [Perilla frutescens var. frutescens]|nr:hypothetical protein C2S51_016153 [Perilla frutescens var. frutescens]